MPNEETYLGDAVYASFDGYHIWLRTGDSGNQRIALEPYVFAALVGYEQRLRRKIRQATSAADPDQCDCNEPGIYHTRGCVICKHAGERS